MDRSIKGKVAHKYRAPTYRRVDRIEEREARTRITVIPDFRDRLRPGLSVIVASRSRYAREEILRRRAVNSNDYRI